MIAVSACRTSSRVKKTHALNGIRFDYNRPVKEIQKALATDEASIDEGDVVDYLREHTEPLTPEYEATIHLWLSRIVGTD